MRLLRLLLERVLAVLPGEDPSQNLADVVGQPLLDLLLGEHSLLLEDRSETLGLALDDLGRLVEILLAELAMRHEKLAQLVPGVVGLGEDDVAAIEADAAPLVATREVQQTVLAADVEVAKQLGHHGGLELALHVAHLILAVAPATASRVARGD